MLHEAAVTCEGGQVHVERRIEFAREVEIAPAQRLADRVEVFWKAADGDAGAQPVREMAGDHQCIADAGEIARTATGNRNPAQGAFQVWHRGEQLANILAQGRIGDEMRHVVEPVGDGVGITQGVCKA